MRVTTLLTACADSRRSARTKNAPHSAQSADSESAVGRPAGKQATRCRLGDQAPQVPCTAEKRSPARASVGAERRPLCGPAGCHTAGTGTPKRSGSRAGRRAPAAAQRCRGAAPQSPGLAAHAWLRAAVGSSWQHRQAGAPAGKRSASVHPQSTCMRVSCQSCNALQCRRSSREAPQGIVARTEQARVHGDMQSGAQVEPLPPAGIEAPPPTCQGGQDQQVHNLWGSQQRRRCSSGLQCVVGAEGCT